MIDQPLEDLADRLLTLFVGHAADPDPWSPKCADLVRAVTGKLGVELNDEELGELMMRTRERRRLGKEAQTTKE